MTIHSQTKISGILKHNINALDAIISLSPRFEKLRNPILRRLMAGRATLSMASKLGGCTVEDFFKVLEPLGFLIDRSKGDKTGKQAKLPEFASRLNELKILELDVRPLIARGTDPLQKILDHIKTVQSGEVLKIINGFEPTPLILLLEKKGFISYVDVVNPDNIHTYFYNNNGVFKEEVHHTGVNDWDAILEKYSANITTIDVRQMEMPLPMHTILNALEELPGNGLLYIYHKRIPVFLLPELKEKGFDFRIREISEGEVHLLVFKSQ